jgi:hypothetical protein
MHLKSPQKKYFFTSFTRYSIYNSQILSTFNKNNITLTKVVMNNLATKSSQILTSSDIENLARRFGGKSDDYIEIMNTQKNQKTINKYALLKEIDDALKTSKEKK